MLRSGEIGSRVGTSERKLGRSQRRRGAMARLAVGSAALVVAAGSATPGTSAAASPKKTQACEKIVKGAVSFSEASRDTLSFAGHVIKVINRSHPIVKRDQQELNGSTYRGLTEYDINVTTGNGEYSFVAQFLGKRTEKDLVAFSEQSNTYQQVGAARIGKLAYDASWIKTDGDFVDPHQGYQWDMTHYYGKGTNTGGLSITKLANGSQMGNTYAVTRYALGLGLHEDVVVMDDMANHEAVVEPVNLNVMHPSELVCN